MNDRPLRLIVLVRLLAAVATLGGLVAACAHSARELPRRTGVEPPSSRLEQVRAARTALAQMTPQPPALSVAVAAGGTIIWSEAMGWADVEGAVPATPDTLFRWYSLSKPLTAATAARLMEQGRLDPNAPLQRWVPSFPDKGAPITPMQLATHTSGIRHYADEAEANSRRHCTRVDEALPIFAESPLLHSPGARETYSSWGYVLLSAVISGAAQEPYPDAVRELVATPLGLRSLSIDDPTVSLPRRPAFYQESANQADSAPVRFEHAALVDNTCKWGAGAWLGTAADAARLGSAIVDGSLLEPATQALFLEGRDTYRAMGVGAGATSLLVADDRADLAVALLANATGEHVGPALVDMIDRLRAIFITGGWPQGPQPR